MLSDNKGNHPQIQEAYNTPSQNSEIDSELSTALTEEYIPR